MDGIVDVIVRAWNNYKQSVGQLSGDGSYATMSIVLVDKGVVQVDVWNTDLKALGEVLQVAQNNGGAGVTNVTLINGSSIVQAEMVSTVVPIVTL